MNGVKSTSSSNPAAATTVGGKDKQPLSEGRKGILKALHEDLLKVRQEVEGGEPLFQPLSFVLENEELVVAEGPVMARFCSKIHLGIDSIDVPVGVAKEAVEYFIKTVYLREEAIRTIPLPLFKDVMTLAFSYKALDWEDYLSTSTENLASMLELMKDTSRSSKVRKRAAEYMEKYSHTIATGLLHGQHQRATRKPSSPSSSSSRSRCEARRRHSPSSDRRSRSPHPHGNERSESKGRDETRRNLQLSLQRDEEGSTIGAKETYNLKIKAEEEDEGANNNNDNDNGDRSESPTVDRKPALQKSNREPDESLKSSTDLEPSDVDEESAGPRKKLKAKKSARRKTKTSSQNKTETTPLLMPPVASGVDLRKRLENAKRGETIVIGPGIYELGALILKLPSGVRIVGQGEATILKAVKVKPRSDKRRKRKKNWCVGVSEGAKGCILENLTFQMDGDKNNPADRRGHLFLLRSPVTIRNCIFSNFCLTFGQSSRGSLCEGTTFLNSHTGICLATKSREVEVRNCKFRNLKIGVYLTGNDNKLDGLEFEKVDNGICVRGRRHGSARAKAMGKLKDTVTGRGNVISNVTYVFWEQDAEQVGIQLVAAQDNILTSVNCMNYPSSSTQNGQATARREKVGLRITNETNKKVLDMSRNNSIKEFTGAPVEVEGENNRFETVRDCAYFRRIGDHVMIDCETGINDLIVAV